MALKPVSVTQLNEYISRVLQTDPLLGNIRVTGEITNLKFHSSGHIYFSIADQTSKVNCFFPASYVKNLAFMPADGMSVIINGYINVYKKGGTYTLFVRSMEDCGVGDLAAEFEKLKLKLDKEGIFAPEHKKPIPKFPKRIGIVTSATGAALQDILKIIKSRTSLVDIIIFPVLVQGRDAARDIASMIDLISDRYVAGVDDEWDIKSIDTLIVGRGGGSLEDLWPFNEEIVARAIYRCPIPIISAVGHEIDFTISDFAADRRAETPTAAAEMAVPNTNELLEKARAYKKNLESQMNNKIRYDMLRADNLITEMKNSLMRTTTQIEHKLKTFALYLEENNPTAVLDKGYSVLEDASGRVITSVAQVSEGEDYSVVLKDGRVRIKAMEKVLQSS